MRARLCVAISLVSASAFAEPPGSYHGALELESGWAWSEGDPRIERWGPIWGVHYYLSDALAIGVRGLVFTHNADTEFNFDVRRASRVSMVLDEYQWQGELTVTYALLHGSRWIVSYDAYALAGTGVLSARPVPVFDPDNRMFDFRLSPSFGGGLGLRIFIGRWLATSIELRDFAHVGRHESESIASDPTNRSTWYGPVGITNDIQLQIGFSVFAPFPSP
jgi:hypothetical protein